MADRGRPTSEQRDADQGFLRRWSRRKAEARKPATAPSEGSSDPAEGAPATLPQGSKTEKAAPAPIDPKDLPDIESMDASSDFTAFMRPGVPEHLRTLALRKLWRSDPSFSKLDGLVEYGEDFSIPSWPKGTIKTAYQVGRGFLERISEGAQGDQALPIEPAEKPADEPARIAAAPSEPSPPEPAAQRAPGSPQEPDSPNQEPARPAARRRRGLRERR